jgi:hypothetical protein
LKVIHLKTNDIEGGAAQASYRLHQGLRGIGIDSQMLVQRKVSDVPAVIAPVAKIGKAVSQTRPSLDRKEKCLSGFLNSVL